MPSVSVQKNHQFMGVTLCLQKMVCPAGAQTQKGRTRIYYHHLVRLPYILADLGRIFDPALNTWMAW